MISRGNSKMALQAIRSTKWRSFLTMLGIIIGVVSVITTVSLGEGVKQQISAQIDQRGDNLITILPGKRVERDKRGHIIRFHPFNNSSVFSEIDYKSVKQVQDLSEVAPFARVTGVAQKDRVEFDGQIIATSGSVPKLLNQKVEYGSFFNDNELEKDFAVIGRKVAEELFKENVPIGKAFQIRNQTFVVRGIFEEFEDTTPLNLSEDYNRAIFIPYDVGLELTGGNIQIQQILAKPKQEVSLAKASDQVSEALLKAHGNQADFTVLKPEETLAFAGNVLDLITGMIAGVAAISLIVGGIGIMNIMLVAVTERTNEIGVRKAVGATNKQILNQFLSEAIILSLLGGVVGIICSILINILMRIFTELKPVITFPIIGVAVTAAVLVGIIFGTMPALRAAKKDPIEALRYE